MLQWIVDDASRKRNVEKLRPWDLAGKALLIELQGECQTSRPPQPLLADRTRIAAYLTTSLTMERIFVDIISHPDACILLHELREEADLIFPQLSTDPTAVRSMLRMDCAIRETLRAHALAAHGLQRKVVQPGGVTTPEGLYLPQGCRVATFAPDLFDEGMGYDPRRAYKEALADAEEGGQGKQRMAVDVSQQSLAFGRGKHACPGRFFAVQNIKLMLGWLVMHYDFEPLVEPFKFRVVGETELVPAKARFAVRRRRTEGETNGFRAEKAEN